MVLNLREETLGETSRALFYSFQRALKTAYENGSVAARTKAEEELKKLKWFSILFRIFISSEGVLMQVGRYNGNQDYLRIKGVSYG